MKTFLPNYVKAILIVMLFTLFIIIAGSCASKNVTVNDQYFTKVVILSSYATDNYYRYKVNYIHYGVVNYIVDRNFFNNGDTILVGNRYYTKTTDK